MMVNIHAWFRFLLMLLISNRVLCFSEAAANSSGFPFEFISLDAEKAASRNYDYIIIGGGTAGCPLATTLSANYSVLIIERGGSPYGDPEIENGNASGKPLAEFNNYTSPSQRFISEEGVALDRARVLGGGTALNGGFYSRASSKYIRKAQWDEQLVTESYEWVEKQIAFRPDGISTWNSAFRDGLIEAGVLPYQGYSLGEEEGTKISASTFDNNGKRHTAADLLKTANPNNIVVLLNATVSKILFNSNASQGNKGGSSPKARGVQLTDAHGKSYEALLKESSRSSEVILSAGAIGSPQLLLLSGIGTSEHLQKFNIPLVLNLSSVGQGIQDHPRVTVTLQSPVPLNFSSIQVQATLKNAAVYLESSNTADGKGNIFEQLGSPYSRGELWLRTTDPRDNPAVRYNYYKHPKDLKKCVHGVRVVKNFLNTRPLQRFKYAAANGSSREFHFIGQGLPNNRRDYAAIAQYCRDQVNTIWHYHGGCHVGSVINERYQVKGIESLRVVDGSTFRDLPGANPQATTLMLGRYVGLKILQELKK